MKSRKRQNKFRVIITMLLLVCMVATTMFDFKTFAEGTLQDNVADTYLGTKTEAKVYDDFENDLWLQFMQKNLDVGETVDVYPRRVPQIITNPIKNDVVRPVFTYQVISGEDCISLSETQSDEAITVTATANGTAIVEVSYQPALDSDKELWSACSDCNHGYFAIVVGEDEAVQPIIAFDQELNKYHTIYYLEGDTVPLSFAVDTTKDSASMGNIDGEIAGDKAGENSEKNISVTCNGLPVEKKESGMYTAQLENRTNIIGVIITKEDGTTASTYQMVDARKLELILENQSEPKDGAAVSVGETLDISFKGITMPVYKLAGIYNPTFVSPRFGSTGTYVSYQCDNVEVKGYCEQWDLSDNNTISFGPKVAGTAKFTSGCIKTQWWGYSIGADSAVFGIGTPPKDADGNAKAYSGQYSYLPEFEIAVQPAKPTEAVVTTTQVATQNQNVVTTTQKASEAKKEDESSDKTQEMSRELSKVKSFKCKVLKKKIQLSWKKVDKSVSGIEVQYSLKKNFSKAKKKKIKATTTSYTMKNLKSKKKYYIRMRVYQKQKDGKVIYSTWVKKSIQTK